MLDLVAYSATSWIHLASTSPTQGTKNAPLSTRCLSILGYCRNTMAANTQWFLVSGNEDRIIIIIFHFCSEALHTGPPSPTDDTESPQSASAKLSQLKTSKTSSLTGSELSVNVKSSRSDESNISRPGNFSIRWIVVFSFSLRRDTEERGGLSSSWSRCRVKHLRSLLSALHKEKNLAEELLPDLVSLDTSLGSEPISFCLTAKCCSCTEKPQEVDESEANTDHLPKPTAGTLLFRASCEC